VTAFRRGLVFLLVLMVCMGIGAAATVLPAKVYTATETLSVEPTGTPQSSGIDIVNFLLPSIIARIGSQTFHDRLLYAVAPANQNAVVEMSATNDINSGVLRIDAKGKDRLADANWADAATSLIQSEYNIATSSVSINVIQVATVPTSPTSPEPVPLLIASATLGVILATAAVALMARPRRTVRH
jgi:uncharacterized protein involved in exopolysaccharide biosynthesis